MVLSGSSGFSFGAPGASTVSSGSTAKDSGQSTFSFAAAAQNLQSTQSSGFGAKGNVNILMVTVLYVELRN